jgi:hypothetical protein
MKSSKISPAGRSVKRAEDPNDSFNIRIASAVGEVASSELTVSFGSITVTAPLPKSTKRNRNVSAGQASLARAQSKIIKPGVSLSVPKSIPLYRADPSDPALLVRRWNGKTTRGSFISGQFRVSAKK